MFGRLKNWHSIILIIISSLIIIILLYQNKRINRLINNNVLPKIGDKAYLFEKESIFGDKVIIKDRNILLVFLNSECSSCTINFQKIQNSLDSLSSHGIYTVGISSDPKSLTKKYKIENNFTFPIISDTNKDIFVNYKIRGVPWIVLLNKQGKIAYYYDFKKSMDEILKNLKNYL